ncbi:cupin domain-containing protein, partial [Candidatus Bathyarchaeota archaeon]|nr:cupin domain-containing protein [Candidatus Bathyarchaeota archaeon]
MSLGVRILGEEEGEEISEEGYKGVNSLWLVRERRDLKGFSSRIFRIQPSGHTSMHEHEREHIALIIRGSCLLECGSERIMVREGSLVEIPPWIPH